MNTMENLIKRCEQKNKIYQYWYELDTLELIYDTTFELSKGIYIGGINYISLTDYSRVITEKMSENGCSLTYTRIVGWEVVLKTGIRSGRDNSEVVEGSVIIPLEAVDTITKIDTSNGNKVMMVKSRTELN